MTTFKTSLFVCRKKSLLRIAIFCKLSTFMLASVFSLSNWLLVVDIWWMKYASRTFSKNNFVNVCYVFSMDMLKQIYFHAKIFETPKREKTFMKIVIIIIFIIIIRIQVTVGSLCLRPSIISTFFELLLLLLQLRVSYLSSPHYLIAISSKVFLVLIF